MWKGLIYRDNDYSEFYEVSDDGNIRNAKTKKVRKNNINHNGYYFVTISLGSRKNKITIKNHIAVADTYIDNPNNYPIINHKDGNKLNNHITNLEWCTYQYNAQHALQNGLLDNYINKYDVPIICLPDMIIYKSITEAGKQFTKPNMNRDAARKNISHALNHNGMAYGKYWKYYE